MKKVDWVYNGILIWEKQEIEGIRGCGIMKQITGTFNNNFNVKWRKVKKILPGGESNPGLPRDRRGYLPLYYRGHVCRSQTIDVDPLALICMLSECNKMQTVSQFSMQHFSWR